MTERKPTRWGFWCVVALVAVVSICWPAALVYCGLAFLPKPSPGNHVGRLLFVILPIAAIVIASDAWGVRWLTHSRPSWAAVAAGVVLFVAQCALSVYVMLLVALGAMFSGRMPE